MDWETGYRYFLLSQILIVFLLVIFNVIPIWWLIVPAFWIWKIYYGKIPPE